MTGPLLPGAEPVVRAVLDRLLDKGYVIVRPEAVLAEVPCRCDESYARRNLIAPDCAHHDVAAALGVQT